MTDGMDKSEFKFPDEAKADDGSVAAEVVTDEEIEVVDDTPEPDRNRAPLGKTADEIAPDEEIAAYSENVQKRINELKRSFHDERRAKEEQARIADEATRAAKYYYEQAQRAGQTVQQAQKQSALQMKEAATKALEVAERDLETAYESGDAKAVVKATKAVNDAQMQIARAAAFERMPPRQAPLQQPQQRVQTAPTPQASPPDTKALQWHRENQWYGKDEEMTSFALGVHQKLVSSGVVPDTDEYYAKLNKRVREVFPAQFSQETDAVEEEPPPPKKQPPATVVAPATRTSNAAPKKIQISKSQAALAAKLGITVQEYARQVKMLQKQDQAKNG